MITRFPRTTCVALVAVALTVTGGGRTSLAPPSPHTSLKLAGGAYLHLYALPLGLSPGAILGAAAFDKSGTRAIILVSFPGSAVYGDPRRMDPTQAFLLDVPRHRLTQLTVDGLAHSVRWMDSETIGIRDGGTDELLTVGSARIAPSPGYRFSADQSVRGDLTVVSPDSSDRLTVYRRSDGRYVVREIGAMRLRVEGVSTSGRFALIGGNLAWVDSHSGGFGDVDRAGASNSMAPQFDDAYGRRLVSIHPLGSAVFQGAYRDGVAYFAFSHGLTRVVAATRDFESYFYPPMPDDPAYSVGDGLGTIDDGGLYLAWPENLQLTVRRGGKFVILSMSFPPGYSDPKPLMTALSSSRSALWPPLQPDTDALDAALLQWRVYPAGHGSNAGWIASYLGRVYRGDAHATFVAAQPPVFPFAVLTRSDDGTLWGASPVRSRSTLWSSHDGQHWRVRYALDGSPGAVGSNMAGLWVALTKPWRGSSLIAVARLADDANPGGVATGGSFHGEQLFFASLPSGFYLVWGATTGRPPSDQGALSAFRLDAASLFLVDGSGVNAYARARDAGSGGVDERAAIGDPAMLQETVDDLASPSNDRHAALATNVAGAQQFADSVTLRSLIDERVWEAEFGDRPSPLGIVVATAVGDDVIVERSVWLGPLHGHGAAERWQRDVSGSWRLAQTLHTWSL